MSRPTPTGRQAERASAALVRRLLMRAWWRSAWPARRRIAPLIWEALRAELALLLDWSPSWVR